MNWLMKCLINLWRLKVLQIKPININKQIDMVENKIRVLKAMKSVQMLNVIEERVPIYEAILETLKRAKKNDVIN
jgi:hypothetical protein